MERNGHLSGCRLASGIVCAVYHSDGVCPLDVCTCTAGLPKPKPCEIHNELWCAECRNKAIDEAVENIKQYKILRKRDKIAQITAGGFTEQQAEWIQKNLLKDEEN